MPRRLGVVVGNGTASGGVPLEATMVSVRGTAIVPVTTGPFGSYQYMAARMTAVVSDPRFVWASGQPPVLRDSIVITFVADGAVAPPARVEFRVVAP